jgi:hypothetical protein
VSWLTPEQVREALAEATQCLEDSGRYYRERGVGILRRLLDSGFVEKAMNHMDHMEWERTLVDKGRGQSRDRIRLRETALVAYRLLQSGGKEAENE